MSRLAKRSAEARFAAFWAAAGLLELPLLCLMGGWAAPIAAWVGVLCHAGAAGLVFLAAPKEKGWLQPTRHWGQPLALITLLLPGAGWALSGWVALRHFDAPSAKDAYRFDDEASDEVNPLAGAGTPEAIKRELADAVDVIPAVDALLSGAPALKRGAIETLSRLRTREAIAWIFKARADVDPEIRFYATTALTRLKRDFETAIQAAERETYRRPGEPETQVALQRIRYEYAVSGMLEPGTRRAVLTDSRARLGALAGRLPEASRLLYLVERELEPARALERLRTLEAGDPANAERWLRERARLLFSMGRHRELAGLVKERGAAFAADEDRSPEAAEWRSAALWWLA